jgi:hypothetical protein
MFCCVYGKMYGGNDLRSGSLEIGFSSMTILSLSLLSLYRRFWSEKERLLFHILLISQICQSAKISPPELKFSLKGKRFDHIVQK